MDECRLMGLAVKGPDVNESLSKFTVNEKGDLRFGMDGIKGSGSGGVINIIEERLANGKYKDIYDFAERINPAQVNKKTWESLAISGAFDSLGDLKRSQYFASESANDIPFITRLINYGNQMRADKESMANSLFGDMEDGADSIKQPTPAPSLDWTPLHKLKKEKELIGIYLSAHPLDQFKYQIAALFKQTLKELEDLEELEDQTVITGGIITDVSERMTKNGKPFGKVIVEDHFGSYDMAFFGDDWMKFKPMCQEDYAIMMRGRVEHKRWGDKALFFNVSELELLSTVSEKRIHGLSITLPHRSINKNLVELLRDLFNVGVRHEDGKRLTVYIQNEDTGAKIKLHSGNVSLILTNELLNNLSQIQLAKSSDNAEQDTSLNFSLV